MKNTFYTVTSEDTLKNFPSSILLNKDAALVTGATTGNAAQLYIYLTSNPGTTVVEGLNIIYPYDLTSGTTGWYPIAAAFPVDSVFTQLSPSTAYGEPGFATTYHNGFIGTEIYEPITLNAAAGYPPSGKIAREYHYNLNDYFDMYEVFQVIVHIPPYGVDTGKFRAIIICRYGFYRVLDSSITWVDFPFGEFSHGSKALYHIVKTTGKYYYDLRVYFFALGDSSFRYAFQDNNLALLTAGPAYLTKCMGGVYEWTESIYPYTKHYDYYFVGENITGPTNYLYMYDTIANKTTIVRTFTNQDHPWVKNKSFNIDAYLATITYDPSNGTEWALVCKTIENNTLIEYVIFLYIDDMYLHTGNSAVGSNSIQTMTYEDLISTPLDADVQYLLKKPMVKASGDPTKTNLRGASKWELPSWPGSWYYMPHLHVPHSISSLVRHVSYADGSTNNGYCVAFYSFFNTLSLVFVQENYNYAYQTQLKKI